MWIRAAEAVRVERATDDAIHANATRAELLRGSLRQSVEARLGHRVDDREGRRVGRCLRTDVDDRATRGHVFRRQRAETQRPFQVDVDGLVEQLAGDFLE